MLMPEELESEAVPEAQRITTDESNTSPQTADSDSKSQEPHTPPKIDLNDNSGNSDDRASTANINRLASGLLESCETELTQVSDELKEFTTRQEEIINHLKSFNDDMLTNPELQQLKSVMEEMNHELGRLGNIRHEMNSVHDKAEKLKMRAERLKGIRVSREKRDEELVAKLDVVEVVVNSSETSSTSTSSSEPTSTTGGSGSKQD